MRIIVCGGRNYRDRGAVFTALDRLHAKRRIDFLIQGSADGADYLAWQWAEERDVPCGSFAADWHTYGRAAGRIRNQEMIEMGKADGVVAFPGGSDTADLVARAVAAGITIWRPAG